MKSVAILPELTREMLKTKANRISEHYGVDLHVFVSDEPELNQLYYNVDGVPQVVTTGRRTTMIDAMNALEFGIILGRQTASE